MPSFVNLMPGDPAPWFRQRTSANPRYTFDSVGGRYVVLCFFASASDPKSQAALKAVVAGRRVFDDHKACFFGVSGDPRDESEGLVGDSMPGLRFFWDFDGTVGKLYGAVAREGGADAARLQVRRMWVVLDPTLRVLKVMPFADDGSDAQELLDFVDRLPPPTHFPGFEVHAPILVLPNVFEPDFCERLVALYEQHGGEESGYMKEVDGKTVAVLDHGHKRRKDYHLEDPELIKETQRRIQRRIVPEILKVHQYKVTRMERYMVCCYAAEDAAHFGAHRDNTTKGTAHRRFAVSINLNADFEGGNISFPEYGPKGLKPPPGGAVVFSCSLLHSVSTVTRGHRYAFLPFLYDDEAARIREANNVFLAEGVGAYTNPKSS